MSRRLISTFLTLVLIFNLSVTNGVLYANENDNLNDQTSINQSQDFVEGFSDVDTDAYEIIDENPVEEQEEEQKNDSISPNNQIDDNDFIEEIDNNQLNEQEEAFEDIELEYDDIEEIDNYLEEPEEDIVDIEQEADTEQERDTLQTTNISGDDETIIEVVTEFESESQTEQSINQSIDEETTIETVTELESQTESQTEETNSQSNADETTIETESEIVSENNHKLISTNSEIEQELMLFTKTPIFGDEARVTYILDFDYYDQFLNDNVTDLPNIEKTTGTALEKLPDMDDIKKLGLPDGYKLKSWSKGTGENYGKTNYEFKKDGDFKNPSEGDPKKLYAVWDVLITYDDDGHGKLDKTSDWVQQNIDCHANLPVLTDIDGYTFKGWSEAKSSARQNTDKIYSKDDSANELKLNKPTILYAVWEEDTYDVILDVKDANATIDIGIYPNLTEPTGDLTEYTGSKKYSELYTLPTAKDIKRTGYSFIGWYLDTNGSGKPIINIVANQKPDNNTQFKYYAIWEPNSYAITYVLDGGSFNDDVKKTIKYNEDYNNIPIPIKKGYKFDAWYEDTEFTTKVTNITKETKAHNHILYAKWEENKYNIKYKISAGGSEFTNSNWIVDYSAPNSRYYTDETILPTADKIEVYESNGKNYLFKGWSLVDGDQNQIITKIPSNTDFDNNIELFAQWHNACEVTLKDYYPNKSDGNKDETIYVIQGSTLPLEYQNPTADGQKFDKWTKGDDVFNISNAINGDEVTLKANWFNEIVETYKIEFINSTTDAPSYITLPEVQYIVAGDKVKEPKSPTALGYSFSGWYMTNATEKYDFNKAPRGDLTLYARWELVDWKIKYELNYGKWSDNFNPTIEYNIINKKSVTLPKNNNNSNQLVKNHYEFKGWYKSINFSGNEVTSLEMESGDLKLYAKWELNTKSNKNTINFIPNGADGFMPTQYIFENEDNKLQENRFNKAGYNFVHWLSQDGKIYQNGQSIEYQENNNLILTAIWQQKPQDLYPSNNGYSGGNGYYGGGGSGGGGGGGVSYHPSKIVPETIYYNQIGNISLPNNTPPLMIGFNNTAKKQLNTLKTVSGVIDGKTSNWVVNNQTGKWQLFNKDGFKATNGFYQMNNVTQVGNFQKQTADTYYFDYLGQMVTGWIQTADNKWYYFEAAKTANEGKMITGWKQIDGDYYYFNYDGSMVVNGWTPDGRRVGTDGKLIKLNM